MFLPSNHLSEGQLMGQLDSLVIFQARRVSGFTLCSPGHLGACNPVQIASFGHSSEHRTSVQRDFLQNPSIMRVVLSDVADFSDHVTTNFDKSAPLAFREVVPACRAIRCIM